jgi:hypothetical protein
MMSRNLVMLMMIIHLPIEMAINLNYRIVGGRRKGYSWMGCKGFVQSVMYTHDSTDIAGIKIRHLCGGGMVISGIQVLRIRHVWSGFRNEERSGEVLW